MMPDDHPMLASPKSVIEDIEEDVEVLEEDLGIDDDEAAENEPRP